MSRGQCVTALPGLKESILSLMSGVSPGFGGLRNEHLRVLAEVWGDHGMQLLETFSLRLLNAELPPWFQTVWGSVTTIPLFKTEQQESLRPVGVKASLSRLIENRVVTANRDPLTTYLEPEQVALTRAGGFILVHSVRMLTEEMRGKPGHVTVKLDIANAHNSSSRAATVEVLEATPELCHLALHAATALAGHQGLEAGGKYWGRTGEGQCQGCPTASPWFCVGWQPYVRQLRATLVAVGGNGIFGNDDGYLTGPAAVVFPALELFMRQIKENCLLNLQTTKTEVFSWEETLPQEVPADMRRAGAMLDGCWEPGFLCYGISVGSDTYVRHKLEEKVEEVIGVVEAVKGVLGPQKDIQAMWSILQCSLAQKLDWQLTLNYPSDVAAAATRLDTVYWEFLEFAAGIHIPRTNEGLDVECVLAAPGLPPSLEGRSYQCWLGRQPVRLSGLGLRSLLETSPVAFCGGVELAVPRLTGEGGFCPPLEAVVGRVEGPERWADFLAADSRTAREFGQAWGLLQIETTGMSNLLGKELSGPLVSPVQSAGELGISSRQKITAALIVITSWRS